MPFLIFISVLCLLAASAADAAASGIPVVVQTEEGPVIGRINGSEPTRNCFGMGSMPGTSDVAAFFGLPYAAAPVGELRWKPPKAAPRRAKALEADRPGPVCPQAPVAQLLERLPMWTPGWSFDEDCLQLNIWSSSLRANGVPAKLDPVLVFIHGGGFAGGNGYTQTGCPFYNGMPIAATEHIVVVTLNYRLGALGFLDLPELRAEAGTSGNYGLQDQRLALQWVQRNIAAFGGDPHRVTIMGESAGGSSVLYHSVLPRSAGLFAQAIAQSGYDLTKQQHGQGPMSAQQVGRTLQASLGCSAVPAAEVLGCLRNATAHEVLSAQDEYLNARSLLDTEVTFAPVADGFEMPTGSSLWAEMRKRPPRIPLLIGSNLNETSLFLCFDVNQHTSEGEAANLSRELATKLGVNLTRPETERLLSHYPVGNGAGAYPSPRSAMVGISTDLMFGCLTQAAADMISAVPGAQVYRYVLARGPWIFRFADSCLGVPHIADTFYNFMGRGLPGPMNAVLFDAGDRALIDTMSSAWWSFVRNGSPSLPKDSPAGSWPLYDAQSRAVLWLDAEPAVEHGFHASECAALPRSGRDSPQEAMATSSLRFV